MINGAITALQSELCGISPFNFHVFLLAFTTNLWKHMPADSRNENRRRKTKKKNARPNENEFEINRPRIESKTINDSQRNLSKRTWRRWWWWWGWVRNLLCARICIIQMPLSLCFLAHNHFIYFKRIFRFSPSISMFQRDVCTAHTHALHVINWNETSTTTSITWTSSRSSKYREAKSKRNE